MNNAGWGKVGISKRRLNVAVPEDLPAIIVDLYDKWRTVGRMRKAAHISKSDRINTRIDGGLKKRAVKIFDRLGLTEAEAIRLFYAQVELHQGIPFPVTVPNATTIAALDETNKPENLPSFKTFRALRNHTGV